MTRILERTVSITAGQQFLGTEFALEARRNCDDLEVLEVALSMGSESKTWLVEHVTAAGKRTPLFRSLTSAGVPGATTGTAFWANEKDVKTTLKRGSQIQVTTTDATSAMHCTIRAEEKKTA